MINAINFLFGSFLNPLGGGGRREKSKGPEICERRYPQSIR